MYRNLHGYLPTKREPVNAAVDFEIAVPTIQLKQSNAEFVFIVYQPQNPYHVYKFRHVENPVKWPAALTRQIKNRLSNDTVRYDKRTPKLWTTFPMRK